MHKRVKTLLLAFFIFYGSWIHSANIIFDLGGVLVGTSYVSSIFQIGIWSCIRFAIGLNNPSLLKNRIFELLEHIDSEKMNIHGAEDGSGNKLPSIMCDWQLGIQTDEEIKEKIDSYIEQNPNFFHSNMEKQIITNALTMMFTPELFTRTVKLFKGAVSFVKKCKENGHNLFILSNFDSESFEILKTMYPKLFDLFEAENILISGDIGLIKPDPQIYAYLLDKFNLDPNNCIFFDDQEVNIEAAKKFGIHGIVCKNHDYKEMEKQLEEILHLQTLISL